MREGKRDEKCNNMRGNKCEKPEKKLGERRSRAKGVKNERGRQNREGAR